MSTLDERQRPPTASPPDHEVRLATAADSQRDQGLRSGAWRGSDLRSPWCRFAGFAASFPREALGRHARQTDVALPRNCVSRMARSAFHVRARSAVSLNISAELEFGRDRLPRALPFAHPHPSRSSTVCGGDHGDQSERCHGRAVHGVSRSIVGENETETPISPRFTP